MNSKNKGFTLIELLAVITIMGILMLVAIPAISRTIENSRRQSLAHIAKSYIKECKHLVVTDDFYDESSTPLSALEEGYYFYTVNTNNSDSNILENNTKSPWGNLEMLSVILIRKTISNNQAKYEYAIMMTDSIGHGIGEATYVRENMYSPSKFIPENKINRSAVDVTNIAERHKLYNARGAGFDLYARVAHWDNDPEPINVLIRLYKE